MRHLTVLLMIIVLVIPAAGQAENITTLPVAGGVLETRADLPEDQALELQAIIERIDATLRGKEIGLIASRWAGDGRFVYRLRYNDDEPYAIASTFKAFAAFYYFMTIPPADWNHDPGSNVYNMVVFSDNRAAGNLLALTAEIIPGSGNPIEKFNDFMQNFFDFSDHSGINTWDAGALANKQIADDRYAPDVTTPGRYVTLYNSIYTIRNRFTARDAALATELLANIPFNPDADAKMIAAYRATRILMSISDPRYRTNFDAIAFDTGAWRKYGYLSEADAGAEARSEVVVVPAPDGGHLVLAMLSGAEPGDSFRFEMSHLFDELAAFDHRFVPLPPAVMGGIPRATPIEGRFNYGFVLPEQIPIYSEPDEASDQIENALRDNMIFPVAALYQGAVVRFTLVNADWGKIDWNDTAPPFRGANAYIRLEDLYIVTDEIFKPVPQLLSWETPPRKYLILDKTTSLLHLMENDSVVFTTPVIMNVRETLDGIHGITTRRISDSRANFPFVSFVGMYGENGQSLYSAPWHWWTQTYNQHDSRYSTGDILIPDWYVTIPGWGRARTDIFIFRWLGGFANPAEARVDTSDRQTLLFVARSTLDELLSMPYQGRERNGRTGWRSILRKLAAAPVIAPEVYFADF